MGTGTKCYAGWNIGLVVVGAGDRLDRHIGDGVSLDVPKGVGAKNA